MVLSAVNAANPAMPAIGCPSCPITKSDAQGLTDADEDPEEEDDTYLNFVFREKPVAVDSATDDESSTEDVSLPAPFADYF